MTPTAPPPPAAQAQSSTRKSADSPLYLRVAELERQAAENPVGYRRRIKAWVVIGIAVYIGLLLLSLVLLVGPFLAGRAPLFIVIAGGVALFSLLSALFARGDRTEGPVFPVTREDAPALWDGLESMRAKIGAPPVEAVEVDLDLNAHVGRKARFALWGRGRTVLRFGLPLILMSDTDELAAVLAHELGHHKAGHVGSTLRTMRIAAALQDVGERFAQGGGLAGLILRPVAHWYVPRLGMLILPIQKEYEREADRAAAAVGLGNAGRRFMARMEVLGKWFANGFWAHRPSVATLKEGMERQLDPESVAGTISTALAERPTPHDEHPGFAERLELLGGTVSPDDEAAIRELSEAAAFSNRPRAWETLFSPAFRARVEGAADELFAKIAPQGPELPPTPLEAANKLAAAGDTVGARQAYLAVASDPNAGPSDRYFAARSLFAQDAESQEAKAAMSELANDPYVGLDVLVDLTRHAGERYHSGQTELTKEEIDAMATGATGAYAARRNLVALLHRDPSGVLHDNRPFPRDIVGILAEGVAALPTARRAWVLWAGHKKDAANRYPLLVVDAGIETKGFHVDDPKKKAEELETGYAGPSGVAVLVGRGKKELDAIVGARPPFFSR